MSLISRKSIFRSSTHGTTDRARNHQQLHTAISHQRRRGTRQNTEAGATAKFEAPEPGIDAHFAGTLPMGEVGPFGTSPEGELNLHPGLYVVDGSILPDLSSKYVTMTIMANADRIAHRLAAAEAASAPRSRLPLQALNCGNASPAKDRSDS
ncbi:hypothetical protein B5K08_33905 [Rhizobium leguminosarum bv. trifolii]|nr:hypothetical protein B5K08_33905 [Rhizobium leguminosarum bv. trifolii]